MNLLNRLFGTQRSYQSAALSLPNGLFSRPVMIFDTETTGTSRYDRVLEFAGVRFGPGEETRVFSSLINPERAISYHAQRIHGISASMVSSQPTFRELHGDIWSFMDGAVCIAHNLSFDARFMMQEFESVGRTLQMNGLCSLKISRQVHPERRGKGAHKLENLAALHGLSTSGAHRAMADVEMLSALLSRFSEMNPELVCSSVSRSLPPRMR
jgi:DNA polymerase III subunit epsilon